MKSQQKTDKRPYQLQGDHPDLGTVDETSPSFRMAIARAKLYEKEGASIVVLSPDKNPLYTTEEGAL